MQKLFLARQCKVTVVMKLNLGQTPRSKLVVEMTYSSEVLSLQVVHRIPELCLAEVSVL